VNPLAQGALRRFTQWPWVEYQTFQLRGQFTTELLPPTQKRFIKDLWHSLWTTRNSWWTTGGSPWLRWESLG